MANTKTRTSAPNKRASLRDRSTLNKPHNDDQSTTPEVTPRKRKMSVVVPSNYSAANKTGNGEPPMARKKWLTQGLYAGQPTDINPMRKGTQSKKRKSDAELENERTFLPLPMFTYFDRAGPRPFQLPWDVYSPLPKGQPKPDEWRKTRANQFVGDAKEEWQVRKPPAASMCDCKAEDGCNEQCLNRIMNYECDSGNCPLPPEQCSNRRFAELKQRVKSGKKYHIGVDVVKTEGKGFGVRAARTFEPHQIIVEYSGEIITKDECHRRLNEEYGDSKAYYLMAFDQAMIIDATKGSIARFINHSCDPNCTMEQWIVNGKPRMALFAGDHGIMTGEELTYDYNYDSFSKKEQACLCGAANCRGVLGPKPSKEKERRAAEPTTIVGKVAKTLKRKATDLLAGPKRAAPACDSPRKKRRVTEPVSKLKSAANPKAATKGRRATSGGAQRALVDKENNTPASTPSSSPPSTLNGFIINPNIAREKPLPAPTMTSQQKADWVLFGWLKDYMVPIGGPRNSEEHNERRAREHERCQARKRAYQQQQAQAEQARAEKQRKLAQPTKGSRSSGRLSMAGASDEGVGGAAAAADDGKAWKSFGKMGKGKWTYEVVPRL